MEDDLDRRQHQWKKSLMEDTHGRQPLWNTTSMEDNFCVRQTQWKMTSMGKKCQWRITSMEEDLKEALQEDDLTKRQPYKKMASARLASQTCTEVGPAQPQLVFTFSHLRFDNF